MRRLHQLYAWVHGYFWLPCPKCGRMFGGHEMGRNSMLVGEYSNGWPKMMVLCSKHDSEGIS